MKVTIALATLAIALGAHADSPAVQTPIGAQECSPTLLMVSGGVPPYQLSAIPAGQTSAAPLVIITPSTSGPTFTWNTNIAAGTNINIEIKDSTGAINFSNLVTIQPGTSNSCLNASASGSTGSSSTPAGPSTSGASSSASTTPSGASPSSSASSTPVGGTTSSSGASASSTPVNSSGTTAAGSSTSTSPASGTNTSTSPASSTTTKSNAASALTSGSAAGIIGALLAALLA